ncbi:hypothetical protein I5907_02040 [Panacibacter sp. DH6]|uniref:Outer membrane protein beta-barrel domain-containing protein n=1 Tax=Panacibacter microcysteis TaxID=2793269 RepID=A0A931E3Q0_9BACT|nr:hypothetical protein [Panacibacter microcysteis]MBG9374991.1 hypothetical protein [Panacibacter microcysteis]
MTLRTSFVKVMLCIGVLCVTATESSAQKLFSFFVHGVYAQPLDENFNGNYNAGLGVEGGVRIAINRTALVATVGYTNFFSSNNSELGNLQFIPVKIGLRQYIISRLVFIHGDVGIARITGDLYNNASRFSGDAGIGVKLTGFEVQLDYDGFTRKSPEATGYSSWIGLKAGINLGL